MQFRKSTSFAATALAGVVSFAAANAAPVTVLNPSFENTSLADGANGAAADAGPNWSVGGNTAAPSGGVFVRNPVDADFPGASADVTPLPAPADGNHALYISAASGKMFAWQNVGALQPNTRYTLTVAVGLSLSGAGGAGNIALVNGSDPLAPILASTPVDSGAFPAGTFVDSTLVLTTGQSASGPLTILLQGDISELIFDNVRLDAAPAPTGPTPLAPTASPSTTVYAGTSSVTLTADAAGQAPLAYQWQSDNGSAGATFTDIPGATSRTYAVDTSSFAPDASAQYRFTVTNASGSATSDAVTVTVVSGPPILTQDTLPATVSDVVGSQVTFTAAFAGSLPITYRWQRDNFDIPGETSPTLTLTNLETTDSGSYSLVAQNALGTASSTPVQLTVNPAPAPADGIVTSVATQTGFGTDALFTPTWTVPNNLIAGVLPSEVGAGDFNADGWGSIAALTDRSPGRLNAPGTGSPDFVTAGVPPYGSTITYTLTGSATGYDLTSLVVFGGWSDATHDQQKYIVFYSTVASPTTFNQLTGVDFNPTPAGPGQSATRVTITSVSGAIARNVAAVKLEFNSLQPPVVENNYAGYSEIAITGVPSAPAPVVQTNISPLGGSDVVGSSVTFTASFTSQTPITYQWRVDKGSGPEDIAGANGPSLTLSNLQLTDSGSYSLRASNASGSTITSSSVFTVNPAPEPNEFGVLVSPASQYGASPFRTTWTIDPASLIHGELPSAIGTGNYSAEGGGGVGVLTDGTFGYVGLSGGGNNSTRATAGNGAGRSVTYHLQGAPAGGYDLNSIVIYAGWNDGGRDQQAYTVYYSTVNDPDNFIALTAVSYNPTVPASTPTADRVTITAPGGTPLGVNVARVRVDFSTPPTENGYAGYAEIGVFGVPSAALPHAPIIAQNTLPATASDIEGSQVTFTVVATGNPAPTYQWHKDTGAGPIDIPGANAPSLTLSNLQLSDTATPGYSVTISNSQGSVTSAPSPLTVNPAPAPANNIVTAIATQTGRGVGSVFVPTWTVAPSLITGRAPTSVGAGNFSLDSSGPVSVLTDGEFGIINPPGIGSLDFITAGPGGGRSVTYTLGDAPGGYDIDSIVVHGGWSDAGRDQLSYAVLIATAADPATFVPLTTVNYNPTLPGAVQSATRSTITSSTEAPLAEDIVAIRFDFSAAVENNYAGYAEVAVYGASSAEPSITITSTAISNGSLTLTGTGGAPNATFTLLTSTDITAPLSAWTPSGTGAFTAAGTFTATIPYNAAEPARFVTTKSP